MMSRFSDIDECLLEDNLCDHGQCTNKAGSYECECELGYIPAEDKKSCVGKLLYQLIFISVTYEWRSTGTNSISTTANVSSIPKPLPGNESALLLLTGTFTTLLGSLPKFSGEFY